ncbi:hypothetical protein K1719_034391 [Acacia pycnantha]|nr:hypothetical protein K1719_034356 [Acacia pycnantha]KAI9083690.1 hypothetical protein K1719_034391 [Acacia pycnantha]
MGFCMVEKVKVPDDALVLPSYAENAADCQISCLKNCSCKAYAYETNLGCMVWSADLLDIQSFLYGGLDIYIRLAYLERELAKDRPTVASVMSMLESGMMDIRPPSQPAFTLRQTMSRAAEQTLDKNELCSINIVTISNFEGR